MTGDGRTSKLRRSRVVSWAPSGWIDHWTTAEDNTKLLTVACADAFYAVRLGFANRTEQRWGISKCIVAPSSTLNDGCNPTGAKGWQTVSFPSPASAGPAPPDHPGDDNAVDVPGRDGTASPDAITWTWSNWTPVESVERIDVTDAPRLLMIRTLIRSGITWTGPNGTFDGYGGLPVNRGFEHLCGSYPADAVTVPRYISPSAAGLAGMFQPVACVQFLTRNPGVTGMVVGDSHHQGTSTSTQFFSFLMRSAIEVGASTRHAVPMGYVSCARGGYDSDSIFDVMARALPFIDPSFVVLPGWTWNDVRAGVHASPEAVAYFTHRLLLAAEMCGRSGAVPIFLTPFPRDQASMQPLQLRGWRKMRELVLQLGERGEVVVDGGGILGAIGSDGLTGTYKAGLSDDEAHPNDAGHSLVADAITRVIRSRL